MLHLDTLFKNITGMRESGFILNSSGLVGHLVQVASLSPFFYLVVK